MLPILVCAFLVSVLVWYGKLVSVSLLHLTYTQSSSLTFLEFALIYQKILPLFYTQCLQLFFKQQKGPRPLSLLYIALTKYAICSGICITLCLSSHIHQGWERNVSMIKKGVGHFTWKWTSERMDGCPLPVTSLLGFAKLTCCLTAVLSHFSPVGRFFPDER